MNAPKPTPQTQDVTPALKALRKRIRRMNPGLPENDDASWQERKSAMTRGALLDATVKCLNEVGYARTTTQLVASYAGISRSALLHHYATKADLIAAVVDYINFRRTETFYSDVAKLSDEERMTVEAGVEIYWSMVKTVEYTAYLEISMGVRTDPELQDIFDEKTRTFDKYWSKQVPIFFPEWADQPSAKLQQAGDTITAVLEGLIINRRFTLNKARRSAVRAFISDAVLALREQKD